MRVHNCAVAVIEDGFHQKKILLESLSSHEQLALVMTARGWKTLQAIIELFSRGYEQQCMMLERVLVESAINLRFISTDPERYVPRFVAAEHVRTYESFFQRADLFENPLEVAPEYEEAIRTRAHEFIRKFPFMAKNRDDRRTVRADGTTETVKRKRFLWTDKNLKERAKVVRLGPLYSGVIVASSELHDSPSSAKRYVKKTTAGWVIAAGPEVPRKGYPLVTGAGCFLEILTDFVEILEIDQVSVIKDMRDRFESYFRELPRRPTS
jgi:hypothetical protein